MSARAKTYELAFQIGGKMDRTFGASMLSAQKSLGMLNRQVSQLETGKSGVKKFRDLKRQVPETEKALRDAQDRVSELAREIRETDNPSKKMVANFERARKKARQLKDKLFDQRTETAKLNRALGNAGIRTRNLATDNRALAKQLDATRNAQQKLNAVIMKQQANARARDSKRAQLFDAAAMAGTVGMPMVFAGRFQQAMAEVKAISGATEKDFATLTQTARQLGASTSFSASEAGEGMKYLAMAGFKSNEVVAAMPGLLSMARAGATDLGLSSDIASDILSGFGLQAGEMNRVADVLTKTFTTSNTTLETLGETMKYVAPVATKAGLGIEDMAAMAGLLGNVGIKGSESGTALRAMILRLAAPTGDAATALAEMGIEARDAEGNIRPMIDLLGEIAQESENMGSGEQLEMLKRIFGERPAASVAELMDKAGSQGITAYLKQIQAAQGTAKKTAAVMDKTLFGSVKRLASAGEGLAISFGGQLIPTFTKVVDGAAWVTSGMIGLTERFPTLTKWVGLAGTGIGALGISVIAGGYAWTVMSGGVLGAVKMYRIMQGACLLTRTQLMFLAAQQKVAVVATAALTAAQWAWNVALNANPLGLLVAGVAALVGAAYVVYKYWEPISDFFGGLWDKVSGFFGVFSKFSRFIPGLGGGDEKDKVVPVTPPEEPAVVTRNRGRGTLVKDQSDEEREFMEAYMREAEANADRTFEQANQTSVTVSPTIHIAPGADTPQVRDAVNSAMGESTAQMKQTLEGIYQDERRVSFG